MPEASAVPLVVATPAALQAIAELRATRGPITFFQSAGCCEGSLPMCFDEGELIIDDREPSGTDICLGQVGGSGFYMDRRQYATWRRTQLVLDVGKGEPEGFSLPAGAHAHFVVRSRVFTPEELALLGIDRAS